MENNKNESDEKRGKDLRHLCKQLQYPDGHPFWSEKDEEDVEKLKREQESGPRKVLKRNPDMCILR